MSAPAPLISCFNPDCPDYIRTDTPAAWRAANDDPDSEELGGFSAVELDRICSLRIGEAVSVSVGGGGFAVMVGVDPTGPSGYRVAFEAGQYFALHHNRPEGIEWEPIA